MSKLRLLTVSLFSMLCSVSAYAGQPLRLTLEELFRLVEIELLLSASYLGKGRLWDRNFSGGMGIEMPHLGNNFAVEASQLIYGGGAVTNAVALAHLGEEMASVELESARSRVKFLLTGFYLDLYKLRNVSRLYDRHIELAESLIEEIRAREQEGVALKNDITRFELRLRRRREALE